MGILGLFGVRASATNCSKRSMTAFLLARCERYLRERTRKIPRLLIRERSSRRKMRFWVGVSSVTSAKSRHSVTAVETLLTCWPPGPELRPVSNLMLGEPMGNSCRRRIPIR